MLIAWVKILIEFIKLKPLFDFSFLKNKMYITLFLIIFIIGFITFCKINLIKKIMLAELTLLDKVEIYSTFNNNAKAVLRPFVKEVNEIVDGKEFFVACIKWEKSTTFTNYLNASYLHIVTYNKEEKKMVDGASLLSDKKGEHKPHSEKSSESNFNDSWNSSQVQIKDWSNYKVVNGEAVVDMEKNYPIQIDKILGITYDYGKLEGDTHRIRFVLLVSKEAYDKIIQDKKLDYVQTILSKLSNDYISAISHPKKIANYQ